MVAKYLPLPVSVTVSQWQNAGHRLIKGSCAQKLARWPAYSSARHRNI